MELYKYAKAERVVTIRLSVAEDEALKKVALERKKHPWDKTFKSETARKMIRYCLVKEIKDLD